MIPFFMPLPFPMENAPKDRPILVWCDHASDPYHEPEPSTRLTTYGAHAESMGYAEDGFQIVEWGGEYRENDPESFGDLVIPDWWFLINTEFTIPANPVMWWPLPEKIR